jgi:hypothetical protein
MGGIASILGGGGVPGLTEDKGIPLGGLGLGMGQDSGMGMFGQIMPMMFGIKMLDKMFGDDKKDQPMGPENANAINDAYRTGLDDWEKSGGGAESLRALNDWYKTNMIDRY